MWIAATTYAKIIDKSLISQQNWHRFVTDGRSSTTMYGKAAKPDCQDTMQQHFTHRYYVAQAM